jgi:hypothetical protein
VRNEDRNPHEFSFNRALTGKNNQSLALGKRYAMLEKADIAYR